MGDIVNIYWVNILCLERWTVGSSILSIFVCWYYQYLCADNVINDIISKQIKGLFPDIVSVCWVIVSIFIGWIFCVWKGGLLDRQYCQYLFADIINICLLIMSLVPFSANKLKNCLLIFSVFVGWYCQYLLDEYFVSGKVDCWITNIVNICLLILSIYVCW